MNEYISRKKVVTIQAFGGSILQVFTVIRGLLLIPLYISFIGDRMYGLWLASGGILVWFTMLDLGLALGLNQRIASNFGKKNNQKISDYFINGLLIYSVLALLVFIIGYALSYPLPGLLKAERTEISILRVCFQLAVLSQSIYIINNVLRGFAQSLLRPFFPFLSQLVWMVIGIITTIALLYNNFGLLSIVVGHLVTQGGLIVFNGLYALILLKKLSIRIRFNRSTTMELLVLIPSLFGAKMGNALVKNIEPTLITVILSPELSTAFVVMRRTADLVSRGLNIIMGATFSSFSHLFGEIGRKKMLAVARKILTMFYFSGLIGFGTYVAVNESFIKLWVGGKYFLGYGVLLLIASSIFIRVLHNFFANLLVGVNDIKFSSYMVLFEAIARVIVMASLIYIFGVSGAPLGLLLTCSVFAIILWRRLSNLLNVGSVFPYKWSTLSMLIINSLVVFLMLQYLPKADTWNQFGLILFFVIVIFIIVNLLNNELRNLLNDLTGRQVFKSKVKNNRI